jgi:hypothetical protein
MSACITVRNTPGDDGGYFNDYKDYCNVTLGSTRSLLWCVIPTLSTGLVIIFGIQIEYLKKSQTSYVCS